MHKVIQGVPIPQAARLSPVRRRKYPFDDMAVGDMFFVANREKNNLSTQASTVGRKLGRKFNTRLTFMRQVDDVWTPCDKSDEGAVQGIGVWRVE